MRTNDVGYKVFKAAKKNRLETITELRSAQDTPSIYNDKAAQNALHWAVINDNPQACFELAGFMPQLLAGARAEDDATPLVLAASLSRWECVLKMLQAMAPLPEEADTDPTYAGSALMIAVKKRQVSVVKALLELNAPKEQRDFPAGRTPLLCAVNNRSPEMIRLIRQYGASDEAKDLRGNTPIQLAVSQGYWDCVIALCETGESFTQDVCDRALLQAVKDKQYAAAFALLKYAKANANYIDESSVKKQALLHLAVTNEQPEMVALLVQFGAKFERVFDSNGDTPLHLAVRRVDIEMIDWCKSLGADSKALASESGVEVVRFAVTMSSRLSDPNQASRLTEKVSQPLTETATPQAVIAIAKGNAELLQEALQHGDINAPIAPGQSTLLEYAVMLSQADLIPHLLEGSRQDVKDKAFQLACTKKLWACAEAIDKVGGLVASLDDKYYHQLSWHRLDNKSVKKRFISELNTKVSSLEDKGQYFEKAAASKTASYRQLLFWKKAPTHTTEQLHRAQLSLSAT